MDNARLHQMQAEAQQQEAAKMGIKQQIGHYDMDDMNEMNDGEEYEEEQEEYDHKPEYNPLRN